MSFEGYERWLCKNGHLYTKPCHDPQDIYWWNCPICNERAVWWDLVDQTNGDPLEEEIKLEIKTPVKYCTCKECGHNRIIEHTTYHIPENRGHKV